MKVRRGCTIGSDGILQLKHQYRYYSAVIGLYRAVVKFIIYNIVATLSASKNGTNTLVGDDRTRLDETMVVCGGTTDLVTMD